MKEMQQILKISIIDIKTNKIVNESLFENSFSGLFEHLNDLFVFYAPTVNGYKRLLELKFSSYDFNNIDIKNDSPGISIIKEDNDDKISFNFTSGDINPYLALSAMIHSIADGINNKLKFEPTKAKLKNFKLPFNLLQAVHSFDKSNFSKNMLGEEIHYHFSHFYTFEYTEYMNQVDEWERKRYFYNI